MQFLGRNQPKTEHQAASVADFNGIRVVITIIAFFNISFLSYICWAQKPGSNRIVLNAKLMNELNLVLQATDGLQKAMHQQEEDQIEISIRDIIAQIDRARGFSLFAKQHERSHLLRILDSAKEHLEQTRTAYGEGRKEKLQEAFNQLANLVRIYKLDSDYGIFFCAKDKASWVQKGRKPASPFRSEESQRDCTRVQN